MQKQRFIIVGSGWRSLFFVRVAKALPEQFELCAMLCRTQEKADKMTQENGIYATASIEECKKMNPDFVVVAVNKGAIAPVSMEWMDAGYPVLCETPASLDLKMLEQLWERQKAGGRLVVAEQYTRRPLYSAMLSVVKQGLIGVPDQLNLSLAHEYHGANLMRAFLKEAVDTPFSVTAKTYHFPVTETLNRYERFTDGRMAGRNRTAATFEFADGKVCWYDFDGEQYRSPIRKPYVSVKGTKGELRDDRVRFLDERYKPVEAKLVVTEQEIETDSDNPNLKVVHDIRRIELQSSDGTGQLLYEPKHGIRGLAEDETAIAELMAEMRTMSQQEGKEALREVLQDCYMTILLKRAAKTGTTVYSEEQSWQKG